jgi:hypothetical protein
MTESQVASEFRFSIRRIAVWSLGLATAGATALATYSSLATAAGFVVGAIASILNLQLLHAVVERLGPNPKPGRKRIISLFAVRYFGLTVLAYVTLRVFGANPAAFISGLLVATLAMLLDSLFELIYAGT